MPYTTSLRDLEVDLLELVGAFSDPLGMGRPRVQSVKGFLRDGTKSGRLAFRGEAFPDLLKSGCAIMLCISPEIQYFTVALTPRESAPFSGVILCDHLLR
jgi:hypothetical protein